MIQRFIIYPYLAFLLLILSILPLDYTRAVSWKPPKNPGFKGEYALNSKLKNIERLGKITKKKMFGGIGYLLNGNM